MISLSKLRRVALVVLLPALGTLSSCGFFPPLNQCTDCTTAVSYMYVANQSTSAPGIAGFALTTTTTPATSSTTTATTALTLSPTPNSAYALSFVPSAMAITPSDSFLYVASLTGGIYVYGVNTDRSITLQSAVSPVTAYPIAMAMQVDPSGNWLITLNANTSANQTIVAVYAINTSTGALTNPGTITLTTSGASQQLAIAPNGVSGAVTLGTAGIQPFTFNATTGKLTITSAQTLIPPGSVGSTVGSDTGVTFDPTSTYCFETETGTGTVRVFAIDATTGAFTEVPGSPYSTGTGPSAVLVDATGAYVYVANKGTTANSVSAFTLSSGTLTEISGSPFTTGNGKTPVSLAEDSQKLYIGVANQGGSPDLNIYTFTGTTAGALVAAGTASTGTDPTSASIVVATH
jgi:6-phosphogluconolactonase (cycloisomerase 2 family)